MDKARRQDVLFLIMKKEANIDRPAAAATNEMGIWIKLPIQIPKLIKTASQAKGDLMP